MKHDQQFRVIGIQFEFNDGTMFKQVTAQWPRGQTQLIFKSSDQALDGIQISINAITVQPPALPPESTTPL